MYNKLVSKVASVEGNVPCITICIHKSKLDRREQKGKDRI